METEEDGCEFTVVPDEIRSLSSILRAELSLSDISKRRASIVSSTDGGEPRIVDRWRDVSRSASGVDRKHKMQKVVGEGRRC